MEEMVVYRKGALIRNGGGHSCCGCHGYSSPSRDAQAANLLSQYSRGTFQGGVFIPANETKYTLVK